MLQFFWNRSASVWTAALYLLLGLLLLLFPAESGTLLVWVLCAITAAYGLGICGGTCKSGGMGSLGAAKYF